MKKFLLSMLAMLTAGSMWAQTAGPLNVPTVKRTAGEVKEVSVVASRNGVIKIQLETETAYRDLQFDLTLPTGINLVTPAGNAVITDADNMVDEHHVAFYAQNGQTVKFAVVDNVATVEGNPGIGEVTNPDNYGKTLVTNSVIFEIPITVAEGYSGSEEATLANVKASTEEADGVKSNDLADAKFNIRAVLLGDVNDDGKVTNADQVAVVMHLLDEPSTPFVFEAADMEYNASKPNEITNADAINLADKLLVDSPSAKQVVEEDVVSDVETEIEPD